MIQRQPVQLLKLRHDALYQPTETTTIKNSSAGTEGKTDQGQAEIKF